MEKKEKTCKETLGLEVYIRMVLNPSSKTPN